MKTSLLSILALAIAIVPVMGEDQPEIKVQKNKNRVAPAAPRHVNAVPRTMSQTPRVQQNVNVTPHFRQYVKPTTINRTYTPNVQTQTRTFTPPDQDAPRPTTTVQSNVNLQNQDWRNRNRKNNPNVVTTQSPQSSTTVHANTNTRNRDWQNRTNTNRNWQNNNTSGTFTFEQARRRFDRHRHDRSWWRSRYNRISLFGGGYYYWDNNYWYPAYGYDPYYSTYAYDEPIYGYNNLEPGQVIANVQTALQEQGYYDDAVDGLIGPRTRAALSNFQRDRGLPITAAIDGPTLQALGLY